MHQRSEMKVLMVAPQPFFEPRGTPISVYQRLQSLSSLGYEIDLVTYPMGEDKHIPGVRIHRTVRIPFVRSVKVGPSWVKIPLDILLFFKTLWMLSTRKYEVIHSHEEASFFAMPLSRLFRVPHLYDMHSCLSKQLGNFGFGNYAPVVWMFRKLENHVLKSSDVVLTIGVDLEEHVLSVNSSANHIRIENIAVHHDVADSDDTALELKRSLDLVDRKVIVYTGTFERYQGFEILFESFYTVVVSQPDTKLIMVGGKPEQVAFWKRRTAELGIEDHVIFTGRVSLTASQQYLELADILVSPRTEGLSVPLKIYSYLYAGRPIVATNIVAHTQILDSETAILVEPSAKAYAAGILQVIRDPQLGFRIGRNARALADREYSRDKYEEKLEYAYLSIRHQKSIGEITGSKQLNPDRVLSKSS